MRKKERQRFVAKAKALLLDLGAEQHEDRFTLQTKAGKLTLHPCENETIGLGTVFSRFDDPQAARQLVDCNPFSGKWNHHYFDGWTVETALDDLSAQMRRVMA